MKFTLAVITALTGLAIANPVSSPNNNNAAEGLLEKRCKGGDEHCKRDSQCCSHKCQHRYASVYRCKY